MSGNRIYERDIDILLLRLFRERPGFAAFFGELVTGKAPVGVARVQGQRRHLTGSGTIDFWLEFPEGPLLLIENKIDAPYSVTREGQGQPQRYKASAAAFRERALEVYTVLLAPRHYLAASRLAEMFDRRVAYESLLCSVGESDRALLLKGIAQASAPYEPIPNEGASQFFSSMRRLIVTRYPDLVMKREPNSDAERPVASRTVYFDTRRTLRLHSGVPRPKMSLQCWDSNAPSASVKIMIAGLAGNARHTEIPRDLSDIGGYIRPAGRSLGIVIDTPRLDTQRPLADQVDDVVEALEAALRLQRWWDVSAQTLRHWVSLQP